MQDFSNKKVLITGGTRGIGYAAAEAFISAGAKVLITGRKPETLVKADAELDGALSLCWDIGNIDELDEKFNEAVDMLDGLDILVNNAGVLALHNYTFETATPADWDYVMNINARGTYFMCQKAVDYMAGKGIRGHIVTMAPPGEYITALRINAAKKYLETGMYTVGEIAEAVGISDPCYFSRLFKNKVGMTPGQYRSLITENKI